MVQKVLYFSIKEISAHPVKNARPLVNRFFDKLSLFVAVLTVLLLSLALALLLLLNFWAGEDGIDAVEYKGDKLEIPGTA